MLFDFYFHHRDLHSFPTRRSSDLSDIKTERPPIEVEGADGVVFLIPPAELWPDKVIALSDTEPGECCRLLLGDQYDAWVDQGGTFGILNRIIGEVAGTTVPKSKPSGRSSASTAKKSSTT